MFSHNYSLYNGTCSVTGVVYRAGVAKEAKRENLGLEMKKLIISLLQEMSVEEEISCAPAMWSWDYLRKSTKAGFFLPLSGGIDSASVACIVAFMCKFVLQEVIAGNRQVIDDVRKIVGDDTYTPLNQNELTSKILYTCYMATENSSGTCFLHSTIFPFPHSTMDFNYI